MKRTEFLDPATMVLLMGLGVGLGIVVHEGFFLVALVIGVIALARTVLYAIKEHGIRVKMAHRHS
jgi:hypothetical protein